MDGFSFLSIHTQWPLLSWLGIEHWFIRGNAGTIIATWSVLIFISISLLIGRFFFQKNNQTFQFLVLTGIEGFMNLTTQTLGSFQYHHFSFIAALFIFILYCNVIGVVPFLEEPTSDLNTTLALGTISFLYINYYAIKTHGFKHYIAEFFEPFFLMFPLHIVGKLASIISISFRLFGNLLGGAVITKIAINFVSSLAVNWYLMWAPFAGIPLCIGIYLFFGIFEGLIQAFVFAMLSLTYLSTEVGAGEP